MVFTADIFPNVCLVKAHYSHRICMPAFLCGLRRYTKSLKKQSSGSLNTKTLQQICSSDLPFWCDLITLPMNYVMVPI